MRTLSEVEQQIEMEMGLGQVPGLAAAIVRGERIVWSRGFGVTTVADGTSPVTPSTPFRIGSVTKPLTSMAIMRLVEAHALTLDEPVKAYVPWFRLSEVGAADRVTLRMLLCHTAGLPSGNGTGNRNQRSLEAYVREETALCRGVGPPGKVWAYSNLGYSLAGHIAEVVSGSSFTDLMRELVFDPLAMRRTTFDPTEAPASTLAPPHERDARGVASVQHRWAENAGNHPSKSAVATVLDLANFAVMQLNGGRLHRRQALLSESVSEMQRSQVGLHDFGWRLGTGYGLGLFVGEREGTRRIGHSGVIGSYASQLEVAPDLGLAAVVLTNRVSGSFSISGVTDQLIALALDSCFDPAAEAGGDTR